MQTNKKVKSQTLTPILMILLFFLSPNVYAVGNADDLCYGNMQTSGFQFGPFGFMTTTTIPIKNLSNSTLSNVHVALGTSSLFSAFSDCGVNGTSGNCQNASGLSLMDLSAFNNGIDYTLPDYSPNETQTVYNSAIFSFLSGGYDLVASYTKNGETYQGVVHACADQSGNSGDRDFELRYQANIRGDVKSIGNTILCKLNTSGQCVNSNTYNNYINLQKAPTSSATLILPTGAKVVYARIYWQGREAATRNQTNWSSTDKENAKKIELKKDSGSYTQLTADIADFSSTKSNNWVNVYSASADASSVVTGAGTYDINTTDFETNTGETSSSRPSDGLGNYGAWMLVVVYLDPNTDITKNVSIFDGYKQVSENSDSVDVNVSGFLTPKSNDVNSKLYVFAGEGDKYISGDHLKMAGERYNTTLTNIAPTQNNAFDSRIDVTAPRDPNLTNNNGIDIQQYNVGTTGKNIITNSETGAKFQFTSTQDTYFPSVIAFSTQLYAPRLCYDYTYGQNGQFITAPSIKPPLLEGTFDKSKPINIKLYFKNLENSDISIKNLKINIDPIDISLAKYSPESVYVTPPNQNISHVSDNSLDINDTGSYVNNIPIGNMGSLDYFYMQYSLDANQTTINAMPINATLNYDLHVDINGVDTNLGIIQTKIQEMNPCQSNSYYQPVPGRFNVVQDGEQKSADPYYYFNLPTQVVGRVGNFKVESMDPSNLNESKGIDGAVAVEMVNVSGFHYATATCTDENATILSSKKVWTIFDNNSTFLVDLNKQDMRNASFFDKAAQNVAFRLSYNATDENGSLVHSYKITSGPHAGNYRIDNFTELAKGLEKYNANLPENEQNKCVEPVEVGNHTYTTLPEACGNAGANNGISKEQLIICNECVYGVNTKVMCSRDNFAIRPEAYSFKFVDYNHSNPSQINPLNDNNGTAIKTVNLAAGYNYKVEINATNHLDNNATPGYTTNGVDANMTWQGPGSLYCNNENNFTITPLFNNGISDTNKTWDNVGKYKLHVIDTHWTAVDSNNSYMQHHITPYFSSGFDCIQNSNIVQKENNSSLNGCNISSDHNNTDYNISYRDMFFIYHPYKFDLSNISLTVGLKHIPVTTNSFAYMADINKSSDENMSYHLDGKITALGEDNAPLTNFVNKCYAVPLDINISTSNRDLNDSNGNHVDYRVRFHDINLSNDVNTTLDINVTDSNTTSHTIDLLIQTEQNTTTGRGYFSKDLNGTMKTRLNMNYTRKKDITVNPKSLTFMKYQVNCTNAESNCTFSADLDNNKTTKGSKTLDKNATFYYGRVHAPDYSSNSNTINNAKIYYEAYCKDCNKSAFPSLSKESVDGIYWYINKDHNSSNSGQIFGYPSSLTATPTGKISISSVGNVSHGIENKTITYNGSTYPYKERIDINASKWLVFNPFDETAKYNSFNVEFYGVGGWSGIGDINQTVDLNISTKKSKRIEW